MRGEGESDTAARDEKEYQESVLVGGRRHFLEGIDLGMHRHLISYTIG